MTRKQWFAMLMAGLIAGLALMLAVAPALADASILYVDADAAGPARDSNHIAGTQNDLSTARAGGISPASQQVKPGETPQGLPADAWSRMMDAIQQDRYRIKQAAEGEGYQAANPGQGLKLAFTSAGLEVKPAASSAWQWSLRLSAYGYQDALQSVSATGAGEIEGNRIEYTRQSKIIEWFINDSRGLEHGFTLTQAPDDGNPGAAPLVLQMRLAGDLWGRVADEGQAILFEDETVTAQPASPPDAPPLLKSRPEQSRRTHPERSNAESKDRFQERGLGGEAVLRYGELRVTDATGRELPAWFALAKADDGTEAQRVNLLINDAQARYPITVDPLITSQAAKLTAADGAASDYFGYAVGISGDTVVVGAYYDDDNGSESGSAYVFGRNQGGSDNWGQVKKITAADGAASDCFGFAVGISGDTVVVGAFGDDDNGIDSGSAYLFSRNQGGSDNWGQVKKITAADGAAGDYFGTAVGISGDTVVVGAYQDDDKGSDSGSAYLFSRNQGGSDNWGQVQKITAADGAVYDYFGRAVGISGDTVVVGAGGDDDSGSGSGSAYLFSRNQGGSDHWGQVKKITAADGAASDWFGTAVGISGDTVVVGAGGDDDSGSDSGSAYLFSRNQGGSDNWGQVQKITAADGAAYDEFGKAVGISGDTVVVGAEQDDGKGSDSGSAYLFSRNQGGSDNWGQVKKITAADGAAGDRFGIAVGISGDTVVVGVWGDGDKGIFSGSAYLFVRSGNAWEQVTKPTAADGAAGDGFGTAVGISGDTVVVGAYQDDDKGSSSGSAYLFSRNQGGSDNWGQVQKITAADGAADDLFGWTVGISGDTVVVGAVGDGDKGSGSGSAYLFSRNQGGSDNWGQVQKITADDGAAGDYFGSAVGISGDTVVVGAWEDDDKGDVSGSAYLFSRNQGGSDNWGQVQKITAADGAASDYFGYAVGISGDTVVVGAVGDGDKGSGSGSAYLFSRNQGGSDNWGQVKKITAADGAASDCFGTAVGISGDTVVVGAYQDDDKGISSGSAYVFSRNQGGSDNWGQVQKITAADGAASDYFGKAVGISGDTVVVGAYGDDDNGGESGSAYLFSRNQGGSDNWGLVQKITADDGAASDRFGWAADISGDTVVVGAVLDDDKGSDSGSAYLFRLTTAPEMAVLGNGISIADGAANPTATDGTDFGSVLAATGQVTHTFVISNAGDANLNLSGSPLVSITGPAALDFSLALSPTTPITPNLTTTFQVRFAPGVEGTRAATVTIANDDSDENPYDFAIQGVVHVAAALVRVVDAFATFYVDRDAPGPARDGLSWTTAYTNVQDALTWTNAHTITLYEVWVAEGVYYPDEGSGHVNNAVTETFVISYNNVQMYGGFAATETLRAQRDWTAHPTILSGDIDANDWNTDTNHIAETANDLVGSNAYHVLYLDGVTNQSITATTTLDGLIITAGQANQGTGADPNDNGGGLYCAGNGSDHACGPTLTNITFSGNSATNGSGMFNDGSNGGTSRPTLTSVTFSGNSATNGGGMFNNGSFGGDSRPTLTSVTFSGNSASSWGGGMYNYGYSGGASSPTLTNVTFSGNSAQYGGGMANEGNIGGASSPALTNVTFSGNSATYYGGGMFNYGDSGASSPTLVNTILWGNTATNGPQIYNFSATSTLSYSDAQGGCPTGATCGSGMLYTDPLFTTPITATAAPTTTGDYRLQLTSPAIDAGDAVPCPATDRRGAARNDLRCDLGAYELVYDDSPTVIRPVSSTITTTFGPALVGLMYDPGYADPGIITVTKSLTWKRKPDNTIDAYWYITPTVASGFSLTLTLCYTSAESNGLNLNALHFWRFNEDGWSAMGGTPVTSTVGINQCATISGVTELSVWTLGGPGQPTAVALLDLTATANISPGVIGAMSVALVSLAALWIGRRRFKTR